MTKDSLPSQSTTLEALLRGEGLDRRNNSKNDEESLLEIQVPPVPGNTQRASIQRVVSRHGPNSGSPGTGRPPKSSRPRQVYPADPQGSLAQSSSQFSFTDDRYIISAINRSAVTTRSPASSAARLHVHTGLTFLFLQPL